MMKGPWGTSRMGITRDSHTVVFLRHGESTWNLQKRFTGWCDVPLTDLGEADAADAGRLIGNRGLQFDVAFTSDLERAWRTCALLLSAAGQSNVETVRSWRLNERHYGMLQGHSKNSPDLVEAFGEDRLIDFRMSYSHPPPAMDDKLLNTLDDNLRERIKSISLAHTDPTQANVPKTESLEECEARAFGYWQAIIAPRVKRGERILIVAHANTIRAMIKALDDVSDDNISKLKIPNGIPLVYQLNGDLQPIEQMVDDIGVQAKYLVSARNHGRMMEYERCVRRKLRSIFEYLDVDGDGKITPDCLANGLIQLQGRKEGEAICEYEMEELLRCIPSADESGGVNLKAFLDAEENIMPKLTSLKLLQ